MYIETTTQSEVNLMAMSLEEASDLLSVIQGADLPQRRTFHPIKMQLGKLINVSISTVYKGRPWKVNLKVKRIYD